MSDRSEPTTRWRKIALQIVAVLFGFVFLLCLAASTMSPTGLAVASGVLIFAPFYLAPTFIAYQRRHHNQGTIAVVNVFLGWTFFGWVVALAMSVSSVRRSEPLSA